MVAIIPHLVGLMNGRRSVRELLMLLGTSYDEREILRVLDYLLENSVVEALAPEKRRILLVKEVLAMCLNIAEEYYHRDATSKALVSSMKASEAPEVISQFQFTDNRWTVDFSIKVLEGLNNRRLMLIFGEWMKVLAQFSALLDPSNLESFISALTFAFSNKIITHFTPFDLRGLEEFSFWLEQLSRSGFTQVKNIRTGSLKPSGENPAEEMIFTLVTRGQAIYGTERITRICAAANIPLMDIPPDYWVDWQKNQSLQRLMIEYAKIGVAAKFTLLVLATRLGLTLPQSITFN